MKTTLELAPWKLEANNVNVTIDPSKWTQEQCRHMLGNLIEQGLLIILQRSANSTKMEKAVAIRKKAADLQTGNYKFGGGGGGARQTPEEKGWIDFLNQLSRKEAGDKISGKNLRRCQESVCGEWLFKTKPEEVNAANRDEMVAKHIDEFVSWMEATNEGLKKRIEFRKMEKEMENASLGF